MGRTAGLSLLFLLLVAVVEVWVYYMERNRRVKALRIHVFTLQELGVSLLSWYIWKRVRRFFKSGNSFSVSTLVRAVVLLFLGFSHTAIVAGLFFVDREPANVTKLGTTCLGVAIFIGASLLGIDIASFSVRKLLCIKFANRDKRLEKTEGKWRTLLALVAAAGLSLAGFIGVSNLTVERLDIPVHGLNPHFNKTTIVQLSDIHLGGYSGHSTLQYIVDTVNELEPDVVVITGDLVDGAVVYLREIVQPLKGLRAKYGVFFSTGIYYTVMYNIISIPRSGEDSQCKVCICRQP